MKRLDLSNNSIQSTSFAATCTGLKWLSLANNPVSDLSPLSSLHSLQASQATYALQNLSFTLPQPAHNSLHGAYNVVLYSLISMIKRPSRALQVLNVGHAKLVGKVKVGALTSLGALILNDNALTSISGAANPYHCGCILINSCALRMKSKKCTLSDIERINVVPPL